MEVKNPLTGCLQERQIKRAIYCIEHGSKDMQNWFKAETGMSAREFIDKADKELNGGK